MIRRVHRSDLGSLAMRWGFSVDASEVEEYHALTEWLAETFDVLDAVVPASVELLPARRDPGRRATPVDDPYNAIVRWCSVKGEGDGPLSGMRVALKDAIAVAGIPMTCGSKIFQSFVPIRDAVVTERILRAGVEIVATTNMDYLAFSGGGDTSAYGYTRNPFDSSLTAGGSSGGSAAALYYDGIDGALGCDQGGSIRVPAAWCGVIGLKPTHGLVPYIGITGIDATYDHCGPMARTPLAAGRLLQVIAGKEASDPRQTGADFTQPYVAAVEEAPDDLRGFRVGVVAEGFSDSIGIDQSTAEATRSAIDRLSEIGAEIHEVSIPEHVIGGTLAVGSFVEGMTALVAGGGNGYHWAGTYWPELALALREGLSAWAEELSPQMKLTLMFGTHLQQCYLGALYAKAQNLRPALRAGYDRALTDVDVVVMPTTPGLPHEYLPDMPLSENVKRGWGVLANTSPTDMSGHPAITIPAAESGGLPVGLMAIARPFDDATLLRLARTYEKAFGFTPQHTGPTV